MNDAPTARGRKTKKLTGNIGLDLPNRLFATGMIGRLSFCQLKTLLAFLQFADNRTGIAWPAVATIAAMIGTTPRHVRSAINGLETLGLLMTTQGGAGRGHPSKRRLCLPELPGDAGTTPAQIEQAPLPDYDHEACPIEPENLPDTDGNAARFVREKMPAADLRTYSGTYPLTYSRTNLGTSDGVVDEMIPESMDVPEFKDAWTEFLSHRRHLGKPVTPVSARRQLDTLAALGVKRAVAAIHHSIANGWQGIYEPQENFHTPRRFKPISDREAGCFPENLRL